MVSDRIQNARDRDSIWKLTATVQCVSLGDHFPGKSQVPEEGGVRFVGGVGLIDLLADRGSCLNNVFVAGDLHNGRSELLHRQIFANHPGTKLEIE